MYTAVFDHCLTNYTPPLSQTQFPFVSAITTTCAIFWALNTAWTIEHDIISRKKVNCLCEQVWMLFFSYPSIMSRMVGIRTMDYIGLNGACYIIQHTSLTSDCMVLSKVVLWLTTVCVEIDNYNMCIALIDYKLCMEWCSCRRWHLQWVCTRVVYKHEHIPQPLTSRTRVFHKSIRDVYHFMCLVVGSAIGSINLQMIAKVEVDVSLTVWWCCSPVQ